MPSLATNVQVNLAAGSQDIGPFNLNPGLTELNVQLMYYTAATPQYWPDVNTKLKLQIWVSLDKGKTWADAGYMETDGGPHFDEIGPVASTGIDVGPLPPGPQRQVKATVTVTGPALSTLANVSAQ